MAKNSAIIHKTAKGKIVDMDKLLNQNELTLSVGNMNTNARGDEIGAGGQIIRKREEVTDGHVRGESTTFKKPQPQAPAQSTKVEPAAPVVKESKKLTPPTTNGDE